MDQRWILHVKGSRARKFWCKQGLFPKNTYIYIDTYVYVLYRYRYICVNKIGCTKLQNSMMIEKQPKEKINTKKKKKKMMMMMMMTMMMK